MYVLKLIMLLASGLIIGAAYSFYGEHVHYSWIALGCLSVIALFYYRDISIWLVTKRMRQLDKYVQRQQKDPVVAFIAALTLGKNREASKALMKMKQTTFRWRTTKYELHFLMMTKQYDEAQLVVKTCSSRKWRHYFLARLAIVQEEWWAYQTHLRKTRDKALRLSLESFAEWQKGNDKLSANYNRLCHRAARGMNRYLLPKLYELMTIERDGGQADE